MSNIRVCGKLIIGSFAKKEDGTRIRVVKNDLGEFLGTIEKIDEGYRITRTDGKVKVKRQLEESFRAVARKN